MTDFERRIDARAAFDKRDPDPSKNYGIGGVLFHFNLVSEKAAVTFVLSTGWLLPETVGVTNESSNHYRRALDARELTAPMPAGLYFHVAEPIADHMNEHIECDVLPGGRCYGDVTFIGSARPFFALIERGLEGLWEQLEVELNSFVGGQGDD